MSENESRIPYGSGRTTIIDAAIRLVAREGLSRLTFRGLASEAGVSTGAVRHSFPTINEVLRAALDQTLSESLNAMSTAGSLESLFDLMFEAITTDRDRAAFEVKVMIQAQTDPALVELAERYYEGFVTFMRTFLREHGMRSDDLIIEMLTAYADGINYQRVVFGDASRKTVVRQLAGIQLLTGALTVTE